MRQGARNAISINGGRPESNNYTLDGLINTDTSLNTPAVILSQDAIQEFKVASENYAAEYGYSANQVNIISKSGTKNVLYRNNGDGTFTDVTTKAGAADVGRWEQLSQTTTAMASWI
jgi:hypothetical protein